MTVFQSYEIQKAYFGRAFIYGLEKRSIPITYIVYEDEDPVLVFPVLESINAIELAGAANGICSLCPIYLGIADRYEDALIFLLSKLPNKTIRMERIIENSRAANLLDKGIAGFGITSRKIENVKIVFSDSYDDWFSSLKKSVRQNLRTAYNRCARDGHEVRFQLYEGGKISIQTMRQLVRIYNNRHKFHYDVKTSALKCFYMEYFDFSTNSLRKNSNARNGILYIDDQIAAFFGGYYDEKSKSIAVPRLSIDPQFEKYSPGYLLLSEAIRHYAGTDQVSCIDLATGTEKYKTDLGGVIYMKGVYNITRNPQFD